MQLLNSPITSVNTTANTVLHETPAMKQLFHAILAELFRKKNS